MDAARVRASPWEAILRARAPDAARMLLGAMLCRRTPAGTIRARIVEVEAYREGDPASHSDRGRTERNASMFGAPGTAYVYRSYGVHWCANVVVEPSGSGAAVLVRAAEVVEGIAAVRARRPHVVDAHDLLRGPGCLSAGLDIDAPRHDGTSLLRGGDLWLERPVEWPVPDGRCRWGPRVGVSRGAQTPWRAWIDGVMAVSRYRRSSRASS